MAVSKDKPSEPNPSQLELLQTELSRRNVELVTLKEIGELTSSTLELEAMLHQIVKAVTEKMMVDICSIYLIDNAQMLVLNATQGLNPESIGKVKLRIGQGITGHTAKTGEAVSVSRAELHPNYKHINEIDEKGSYSMLSVPLQREGITVGVINVQTYQPRYYTLDEIQFLSAIASQITGAIRNTQMYEEEKKALDEVSRLYEIGRTMSSTLQLDKVLKAITKAGAELLGARGCILRLLDQTGRGLEIEEVHGVKHDEHLPNVLELGQSIAGRVAETGESILIADIKSNQLLKSKFKDHVTSLVCVPMVSKDKVIGTISVFDRISEPGKFNQDDERLLSILASQAAISIENARLFETIQRNEHKLREIREQLLRVERLAAVGELSAKVAHEIRNPLVSIGGFTRKVYENFPEGVAGKPYLKIVIDEVGRLEKILHEILELSSPSLPSFRAMDLHQILEETILMVREVARKNDIDIVCKYDAKYSMVKADREQLKQAFLNLFRNSLDAMEGTKGSLKIQTYQPPKEKGKPDRIMVTVKDSGSGIESDVLEHIFDPFYSSKPRGSGLGLPITHKIITAHNATINVESMVKQGTIFYIEFPAYHGKSELRGTK